ncbi:DNA-directed RNA polymerase subunit beta [Gorillibacterium sp. sgz5001074]|uniref:DNA-directed RNA polymerase subunit beta n=1 Tax=Gorillibacterium sp. sgz5001074 TaxID=3446695 RepID=UPI003F676D6F
MAMQTNAPKSDKRKPLAWRRWWPRYVWPVLRHLIIPAVCVLALFIGMAAGYSVLGDRPMSDIWDLETWKHMFDLVFSDT